MTTIQDLPLDAWAIVMLNVKDNDMLNSFNKLINCQAINIPISERLNTFWIITSHARLYNNEKESEEMFIDHEDPEMFKNIYHKLYEMGFNETVAMNAVRRSEGSLHLALAHLGIS